MSCFPLVRLYSLLIYSLTSSINLTDCLNIKKSLDYKHLRRDVVVLRYKNALFYFKEEKASRYLLPSLRNCIM